MEEQVLTEKLLTNRERQVKQRHERIVADALEYGTQVIVREGLSPHRLFVFIAKRNGVVESNVRYVLEKYGIPTTSDKCQKYFNHKATKEGMIC